MRWSLRIATVAGIGIFMHWTFWLLIAWVLYMHIRAGATGAVAAEGVGFVFTIFACVVLHELGHALAARRFGVKTRDITILPIGGVARLERMPEKPLQEFIVAVAGPAVNVAIVILLAIVLLATSGLFWGRPLFQAGGAFLSKLLWVNIILVVFNMIPAFPMDGGRVLRAILAMNMDYAKATRIAASVGQFIAILFGALGLFYNPLLLFIALFVFLGAQAEAQAASVRSALSGLPVRDAMMTDFRALTPADPVSAAVDSLLAGAQTEFPVMEHGRAVGLLTRDGLLRAVSEGRSNDPVRAVMRTGCESVDEAAPLNTVFERMQSGRCPAVVVTSRGQPVGLLTLENIGELVMLNSAFDAARARGSAPPTAHRQESAPTA